MKNLMTTKIGRICLVKRDLTTICTSSLREGGVQVTVGPPCVLAIQICYLTTSLSFLVDGWVNAVDYFMGVLQHPLNDFANIGIYQREVEMSKRGWSTIRIRSS